jgi:hypothetical protein
MSSRALEHRSTSSSIYSAVIFTGWLPINVIFSFRKVDLMLSLVPSLFINNNKKMQSNYTS